MPPLAAILAALALLALAALPFVLDVRARERDRRWRNDLADAVNFQRWWDN